MSNLSFPTMGNWARANSDLRNSSHFYRQFKTHLRSLSPKATVHLGLCKALGARSPSVQVGKEGGGCSTRATEGKVPSPLSPCPGTATIPGKGQVTIWRGRFKANQHSWLITNFMAREEARWRLSTLMNACFKSTLHCLPDMCFTKARSCCCY